MRTVTPSRSSKRVGLRRERRWKSRQDPFGGLDQENTRQYAGRSRGSRGEACRAPARRSACHLTPVGPGPTTTNVSHARARCVGLLLGGLKGRENAAARAHSALERLHLEGMRTPLVMTEIRVCGSRPRRSACRSSRLAGAGISVDAASELISRLHEVEAYDLGEDDAHIPVALEDRPQRIGDPRRARALPSRPGTMKRLEEMEAPGGLRA